jgi:hypothetical protein
MSNALPRYRSDLAAFIARFAWQYFITLTWDPAWLRRPLSPERAENLSRKGMCVIARSLAGRHWQHLTPPTIQFLGVVERTAAGNLHVHLAVAFSRSPDRWVIRKFQSWWLRHIGFSAVKSVTDIPGLGAYMAKAAGPHEAFFVSADLR